MLLAKQSKCYLLNSHNVTYRTITIKRIVLAKKRHCFLGKTYHQNEQKDNRYFHDHEKVLYVAKFKSEISIIEEKLSKGIKHTVEAMCRVCLSVKRCLQVFILCMILLKFNYRKQSTNKLCAV